MAVFPSSSPRPGRMLRTLGMMCPPALPQAPAETSLWALGSILNQLVIKPPLPERA